MPATGPGDKPNRPRSSRPRRVVKRNPPPPPTPRQVRSSRAQANQYASQGRAVEKAANRQRAEAPARAQERAYASQGVAVKRVAREQKEAGPKKGLHLAPGSRYGAPDKHGNRPIVDASGKKVGTSARVLSRKERSADVAAKLAPGEGHDPLTIAKNAAKDVVDLYANAVPSTYHLVETAATGHPAKAAKMLAEPYVQAFKHPGKAFTEHPVQTLLLGAGVKAAVGHGVGAGLRAAPSETLRRAGSTERAARTLPGSRVTEQRAYSKNVIKKAEQKTVENVKASRAARKGTTPPSRMNDRAIQRRVDEDVQAAKIVSQQHAGRVQHEARKAIGKKPTAATNLAAQGVTTASRRDLEAYHAELEQHARHLAGNELKVNERTRKQIKDALKHHDERQVAEAARRYSEHRAPQEQQAVSLGLVKPAAAEETRLAPVAVRRLGASSEAQRAAKITTKDTRRVAERGARQASKDVAKAEQTLQRARANARVSVATRKKSPALAAAEQTRRQAVVDLTRLKAKGVVGERVREARQVVRTADRAVAAERARIRGVAPAPADALRRALTGKETARTAASQARSVRATAVAANRSIKKAPFVSREGQPVTLEQVRAAHTGPEPAFVSHAGTVGRSPALPVERPSIPVKEQRTGEAVRRGTLDVHPDALVEQSVRTQGLIDAAQARNRFIDDFGYRQGRNVERYKTQKTAENVARDVRDKTGVEWSPMQHGDGAWTLVPKTAKARLVEHATPVRQHPALKAVGAQWRRNVLAFSPKWLAGNTLEAAFRSAVAGAGPRSYLTAKRAIRTLERKDPQAAEQLKARTIGGGQYRVAERVASERLNGEDLGTFAKTAVKLRNTPGPKQVADTYAAYTKVVFNSLNGRLETQFQTAMLGKALRDSPLMSGRVVKLSQRAAEDAAKGLKNTDAQVALGREVDRMYGAYGKFSPGLKQAAALYTPFVAWTLNATNFLFNVLPRDHPVFTSLLASANQASQEWRAQHGLVADFFGELEGMAPGWLQNSIPGKDGSHLRVGRFLPFGLFNSDTGSPLGGAASLLMPQFSEILQNLGGKDWTGDKNLQERESGARDFIAAAASFLEGQVPLAAQAMNVAGVRTPNMADTTKIKPGAGARARAQFDPFAYTPGKSDAGSSTGVPLVRIAPVKIKPVKIKPVVVKVR